MHCLKIQINASPEADNILQWTAVICGPDETPWEGGTFPLSVTFTEEFPNKPPNVHFFIGAIFKKFSIQIDIFTV